MLQPVVLVNIYAQTAKSVLILATDHGWSFTLKSQSFITMMTLRGRFPGRHPATVVGRLIETTVRSLPLRLGRYGAWQIVNQRSPRHF